MECKAIIVDDSLTACLATKMVLKRNGMEVTATYSNAEDFLDSLGDAPEVDVVIMDLVLPNMGGIDAIRRAKELGSACKFIVISSLGESEQEICDALEAGADDVLSKPYDEKTLIGIIDKVLT